MRIAKAVQMEKLQAQVTLIGNAIYSQSGRYLYLTSDPKNIGGQATYDTDIAENLPDNPFIVPTIRFDDILPIIQRTKQRSFLLKADIEASEHYIFNHDSKIFDHLDIPIIILEWDRFRDHVDRGAIVIAFLTHRKYIPTVDTCQKLNMTNTFTSWPPNVFWIQIDRLDIC